jgi:hypothetical protein
MKRCGKAGAALAALALLGAAAAEAGTGTAAATGTIGLSGVVSASCTVRVSDAGIDLDVLRGETARTVATITETCNDFGYTISFSSLNRGRLVGPSPGDGTARAAVPYQISYDGRASDLGSPLAVWRLLPSWWGRTHPVSLTLPATPQALAGTYSDTITVAIVGK